MNYDVIVIGAGASGLLAAIVAARNGSSVLVIEHKDKAGKKILATGNGKCNYTNLVQKPDCYRSNDSAFVTHVLSCFDVQKTIRFFEELGIFPKEKNGYLYPNSEQAASVVQVLLMECTSLGVRFIYQEHVKKIMAPDYTVVTDQYTYKGKNLILATGGCASPNLGSDGSGFTLAKSLGHTIIKPLPALVSLKSPDKYCKTISGVRTPAKIWLYSAKELLASEEGEIIFTDYGISGIPIMQVSRFAAKALDQDQKVELVLDCIPSVTKEDLRAHIKFRIEQSKNKSAEQMMVGLLNYKLSYVLLKEAGLDSNKTVNTWQKKEIDLLVSYMKEFRIRISGTNSFDQAQVSMGGVNTKEINPQTMESKRNKNLYFAGEIVDVDGTCGGYNLQWAWSSGYLAGAAASKKG